MASQFCCEYVGAAGLNLYSGVEVPFHYFLQLKARCLFVFFLLVVSPGSAFAEVAKNGQVLDKAGRIAYGVEHLG